MKATIAIALIAASLASAAAGETYSCTLDPAQAVNSKDGKLTGFPITFGDGDSDQPWTFKLTPDERDIEIDWSDSPIQLNGKGPSIQTGPESFATFLVGRGPCMFTERHCGSIVHISKQSDKSLSLMIQPIALTSIENGEKVPFEVYLVGKCVAEEEQK